MNFLFHGSSALSVMLTSTEHIINCYSMLPSQKNKHTLYMHIHIKGTPPIKPCNLSTLYIGPYYPSPTPPLCSGRLTTTLLFSQVSQGRHIYEVIVTDANGLRVSNQISFESKLKGYQACLGKSCQTHHKYQCLGYRCTAI